MTTKTLKKGTNSMSKPVDAVVRVSFQSKVKANHAVNLALVGHRQHESATGPFERIGTALYFCRERTQKDVAVALKQLGAALVNEGAIDCISITIFKHTN
jgi:hypothetical protein